MCPSSSVSFRPGGEDVNEITGKSSTRYIVRVINVFIIDKNNHC